MNTNVSITVLLRVEKTLAPLAYLLLAYLNTSLRSRHCELMMIDIRSMMHVTDRYEHVRVLMTSFDEHH